MNEHKEENHGTAKSDFMGTVEGIRQAEKQAEDIKEEARKNSDHILKKAKESVVRIKNETEDEIVKFKNARLQEGVSAVETGVAHILSKAKSDADQVRNEQLNKKTINGFMDDFILSS